MTEKPKVGGIRDIDGQRISEAVAMVGKLAIRGRQFLDAVADRGIVLEHSWLGTLTVKLGERA